MTDFAFPRAHLAIAMNGDAVALLFAAPSRAAEQLDCNRTDKPTPSTDALSICAALGVARLRQLRAVTSIDNAAKLSNIMKKAVVAFCSAGGFELRAAMPAHTSAAIEFAGWNAPREPDAPRMAAMLNHYRAAMAERGEHVGDLILPFDKSQFVNRELEAFMFSSAKV